jgi:hypothetical protein
VGVCVSSSERNGEVEMCVSRCTELYHYSQMCDVLYSDFLICSGGFKSPST